MVVQTSYDIIKGFRHYLVKYLMHPPFKKVILNILSTLEIRLEHTEIALLIRGRGHLGMFAEGSDFFTYHAILLLGVKLPWNS